MLIIIIVRVVMGVVTALIASIKGRNVVGWFFVGFFLGIIGVILAVVMPNLKAQRAQKEHDSLERRRLREQLRQERLKNEAYRRYSTNRLDVHDQHLGLDTRTAPALPEPQATEALPSRPEEALTNLAQTTAPMVPAVPIVAESVWYYEASGRSVGPVNNRDMHQLVKSGAIERNTLVWTEGYDDWVAAEDVEPFRQVWDHGRKG